jgi:hypothetical protein
LVDKQISQLYEQSQVGVDESELLAIADHVNTTDFKSRVPWVDKLLNLDMSLGVGGFIVVFDGKEFGFFHLVKYNAVYRPIRYVYMDICLTLYPADFSRDQAKNACAHIEKTFHHYLETKGIRVRPRATLGYMLHNYDSSLDSGLVTQIDSVNNLIYGSTKHNYDVDVSKVHLLTLCESLMIYFVARKVCIALLEKCGAMQDVISEINKKAFFGQTWLCSTLEQ